MKLNLFLVLLVVSGLMFTGCQQDPMAPIANENDQLQSLEKRGRMQDGIEKNLTVMTRNIYVGASFESILTADDPEDIPVLVLGVFQDLLSTDIVTRVQALADEIAVNNPQMIGLQEVSMVRYQSPGDFVTGNNTPATYVMYNYLDLLMEALAQRKLKYRVAGIVENFDVEVPMVTSEVPTFDDVRLTDFDVVLVRNDVRTYQVETGNYEASFDVPVNPQVSLTIKRGYVIVDVKVRGKKYCFANTHLEDPSTDPLLEYVQLAQAQELVNKLDNQMYPIILVGDFNSKAPNPLAPTGMTYQYLLSEQFVDVWNVNQLTDDALGYTYGHSELLRDRDFEFYERIDYIFFRKNSLPDRLGPVKAWVIGKDINVFNEYGIWPSDHSGVVASFMKPKWNRQHAWGKN